MATTVTKDAFKITNMKFSDLDNKFFNLTDAAEGNREIKFSKFIRRTEDPIPEGSKFSFDEGNPQPNDSVISVGDYTAVTNRLSEAYGVLDSTENGGIPTTLENISMSQFKGSVTFYKVTQSGLDDDTIHPNGYRIENQSWNTNLNKLIPKEFEQAADGQMGMEDVTKYACIYQGASKNLQFLIKGKIYGGGADSAAQSGGNAMWVDGTGDRIPITLTNTAQVYAGGGWGGYGGAGGKGGDGAGANTSKGGVGGPGGSAGVGGPGRGYKQAAAAGDPTGGTAPTYWNGKDADGEYLWYRGSFANATRLQFSNPIVLAAAPDTGAQVEVVGSAGVGFRYVKFNMYTWGNAGNGNETSWSTVGGLFSAREMAFSYADGNNQTQGPFLVGGNSSGFIGWTGNQNGVRLRPATPETRLQFAGNYDDPNDDDDTRYAGYMATLRIEDQNISVPYRVQETFQGGDGGRGGNGGAGGKGGDWGERGGNGGEGTRGLQGGSTRTSNNGKDTEPQSKKNPKFIYNSGDKDVDISVSAVANPGGDAWGVVMLPLGEYGLEEYFGKNDVQTIGNNIKPNYADYATPKNYKIKAGEYFGPISHWSVAPWQKANVAKPAWDTTPILNIIMGAFSKIKSNRELGIDDVGVFGKGMSGRYNDVRVFLSGDPDVIFTGEYNGERSGEPGSGPTKPQLGTRGGRAISPILTGNFIIDNQAQNPSDSYKSDDNPNDDGTVRADPPAPTQ